MEIPYNEGTNSTIQLNPTTPIQRRDSDFFSHPNQRYR
jgi:hypothetical protein